MRRMTRLLAVCLAAVMLLGSVPAFALPDILNANRWPDPRNSGETDVISYDWAYRAFVLPGIDSGDYLESTRKTWSSYNTFINSNVSLPYLAGENEDAEAGTLFQNVLQFPQSAQHTE